MTPEAQAALQEAPRSTSPDPGGLREALDHAVRALARCGLTPAAYASLPHAERDSEVWREAVAVWRAAGIELEPTRRIVLRYTSGQQEAVLDCPSTQAALEAAIAAIELNESYPVAIEVDGRCVLDRASILRAWEDRHDPG